MFGRSGIEQPGSVLGTGFQELLDPRLLCFEASQDVERLTIHVVIVLGLVSVSCALTVLAHEYKRPGVCRLEGKHQVEQDEWIWIERFPLSQ